MTSASPDAPARAGSPATAAVATAAAATAAASRAASATADAAGALARPTGLARELAAPPRVALVRTRAGERIVAASLAGFALLFGLVRAGDTARIDRAISRALQRHGRPAAPLLRAVSWPGFPPQSRVLPVLVIAGLWGVGLRLEALFQAGAWSTAALSEGLKALARRPRPATDDALEIVAAPLRGSSFPSGHVLTYIGVYGFLAHLAGAHLRGLPARIVAGALVALVGLVGPSRVQQGHHWPSDVLGSYLVGLPLLAAYVEGYRRAKGRLLDRRPPAEPGA
ncbi:MAG TPA: phosphatase PAP2 family protein [Candidatus Limnocylindrales bacterium]|nr:phosphatase PAP2 family protein [Candidatus Limnocylindrales bacterium]